MNMKTIKAYLQEFLARAWIGWRTMLRISHSRGCYHPAEDGLMVFWRITSLLAMVMFLAPTIASATTFTVTKTADTADNICDADCSLREAIYAANNDAGTSHIISIPAGTYTITRAGAGEEVNSTGDFDFTAAAKTITVSGATQATTIIDANSLDRVFDAKAGITLILQDLTVKRGSVSGSGGCVLTNNTSFTATNVTFDTCATTASNGGALYMSSGGTLSGVTFTTSTSFGTGGTIYMANGGTLENVSISNSWGKSGGGAIYNASGALNINVSGGTSSFTGNYTNTNAGNNGGTIYSAGNLAIKNSTFTDRSAASNDALNGGAIYVDTAAASFTIDDSTFDSFQTFGSGGAIYTTIGGTLTNVQISNSYAQTAGGAIYNSSTANTLTVQKSGGGTSSFTGNYCGTNTTSKVGGSIYSAGNLAVYDTAFTDRSADANNDAYWGGAVYVAATGTATIQRSTFSEFESYESGGAVYLANGGTLSDVTFTNNKSSLAHGGAIYNAAGTLTINGTSNTFTNNDTDAVASDNGGAIYTASGVSISNASISNSNAYSGGAIYNSSATAGVTVTGSTFTSNTSVTTGGAIYSGFTLSINGASTFSGNIASTSGGATYSGNIDIDGTSALFSGNQANNGHGGAIYTTGNITTTSGNTSTFTTNTTTGYGGAIYVTGTANITGATFGGSAGNGNHADTASQRGGAVYVAGAGTFTNCTVSYNSTAALGGGIYGGNTITITNSTISENTAGSHGGGVYSQSNLTVNATSIINHNTAAGGGGGLFSNGTATIDGTSITNNISTTSTVGVRGGGLNANGVVIVTNSTITGNTISLQQGGGIATSNAAGTVSITSSTVSNNTATEGGGVYGLNTVSVTDSTIAGNTANNGDGGGIRANGDATITRSTISGNSTIGGTGRGGGIYRPSSNVYLYNSTLSGNTSTATGSAVWTQNCTITNSTIYGNSTATAGVVGGVYKTGICTYTNSITANNTSNGAAANCNATPTSGGYNIESANTCSFAGTGDLPNTNPLVNALASNGGPTQTHALQSTSPAIDKGDNTTCAAAPISNVDQRGQARPIDGDAAPGSVCDIGAYEYVPAVTVTTTLATGTDPGNTSLAPGGAATNAGAFSFQTSSGTDVITAATVTLAAGTSGGLSLVEITNVAGTTVYGSVANPASDTPAITLSTNTLTATTTLTEYRIRVTPKTHANMPAPAGSSYAVTAYISNWTGTNTHAGSDAGGTTVTIDNLSTANVTASTATAGDTQVVLAWTNPADADLHSIVVLRRASSAVADVPVEGTTYVVGNTIGTATVACVVASPTATCTDTGLTNGTPYHYKIFAKDSNGNYSATGVVPTGSPATPVAASPSLTFLKSADVTYDPVNNTTNPKYIPGSYALFTMRATNSGTGTVDNNTLIITDPIPANTEVFTGNLSGGAPFIFVDGTPVSGLSCTFTALGNFVDCMDFSNDSGVSWTYVPNGSFDPAVTNIRFSLSGTMNGTGGGNPYFDLKFRVRVK